MKLATVFVLAAAAVPAMAKRGLRKAPKAELENFENVMRGRELQGNCNKAHTCDGPNTCFTCGDVTTAANGDICITINTCKEISWMCCTTNDCEVTSCTPESGTKKCEDISSYTVCVPAGTDSVTIQTHDGQTNGLPTDEFTAIDSVCKGSNNANLDPQNGACANQNGVTAHCNIQCDLPVGDDKPIADGDPHIKGWNGKWFDYMGECDLKFLDAKAFDGHQDIQINIRTKIQYDYSYIEAAAIKIGEDVLEVGEYGDFAVNGVDTPYLGGKAGRIGGYQLVHTQVSKKKHTYDIILNSQENITLASYKNLISVKLNVGAHAEHYFSASEGILGSYSGDFLARDGKTIMEDTDAFAQEWQVSQDEDILFRAARAPQAPEKCIMPDVTSTQRRLSEHDISEEAAETACAHKHGAAFSNCVYDVLAIGDLELADAGSF